MTELKIENGKIKISKSQVLALKEQVSCQKGQVVSKTLVQNNAVSVLFSHLTRTKKSARTNQKATHL